MTHISATPVTFVVTDIETDDHSPLRNSMLSFASVAVTYDGTIVDEFESVLERRESHAPDPGLNRGARQGRMRGIAEDEHIRSAPSPELAYASPPSPAGGEGRRHSGCCLKP